MLQWLMDSVTGVEAETAHLASRLLMVHFGATVSTTIVLLVFYCLT
jgi:hypothetical protein